MSFSLKHLFVLCVFTVMMSYGQTEQPLVPKTYVANFTETPIEIDGVDNEASWAKTQWSSAFIDIEGVKQPTYKTQVKMLWDNSYFYILAKIEEPHVWADIKEHDAIIFHNNDFEVFVDPDGDANNYYEIEINAINTVWDLFITKPYREKNVVLNDWTATGLKSAITIDGTLNNHNDIDTGWTLEIAIPWSVYKTSYFENVVPKDQFWRVNFSRVNWDFQITNGKYERKKDANNQLLHEYNWVWSPQGVINMHEPEKWGYVFFSSKTAGSNNSFNIPDDEPIKWELFKLYRAQKSYFETHKQWATSLQELTTAPLTVRGQKITPILETHKLGWNIMVVSPFTNTPMSINQEGAFFKE